MHYFSRLAQFESFDAGDAIGLILVVLEDAFDTLRLFSQGGLRSVLHARLRGSYKSYLIFNLIHLVHLQLNPKLASFQ